jgi:hypothetical protein
VFRLMMPAPPMADELSTHIDGVHRHQGCEEGLPLGRLGHQPPQMCDSTSGTSDADGQQIRPRTTAGHQRFTPPRIDYQLQPTITPGGVL